MNLYLARKLFKPGVRARVKPGCGIIYDNIPDGTIVIVIKAEPPDEDTRTEHNFLITVILSYDDANGYIYFPEELEVIHEPIYG